ARQRPCATASTDRPGAPPSFAPPARVPRGRRRAPARRAPVCVGHRSLRDTGRLIAGACTAGDMRLELFLTEHIAVDAFGVEQRAFAALVTLLDILPGLVLHLVGHAPPGTPCSKLE